MARAKKSAEQYPVCPPEIVNPNEGKFCALERLSQSYECRRLGYCALAAAKKSTYRATPLHPEEPGQPLVLGSRRLQWIHAQNLLRPENPS